MCKNRLPLSLILFLFVNSYVMGSNYTYQGFGITVEENGIVPNELNKVEDIMEVANYVTKLIDKDRVAPKDILVIFDVDGTLTNEEDPGKLEDVTVRNNAIKAVEAVTKQGVTAIASSAWKKPVEAYERLIKIGMKDLFKLEDKPKFTQYPHVFITFKSGNFAAVKNAALDMNYFRQKAFAPHAVFNTTDIKFTHVILVEDSSYNIQVFYKDINSTDKPYKDGTHFTFFYME